MIFTIRNVIPKQFAVLWLFVGITMFLSAIGWDLLEPINEEDCITQLSCLVFDVLMYASHILGGIMMVIGMMVLLGNENIGTKEN